MKFHVFLFDHEVGALTTERGRLGFKYIDSALDDADIPPVSIRLPKRSESYGDNETRAFFENLLPEEQYRQLIASALRISETNTAGLLGAIGGECAGAVSVWPSDTSRETEPRYRTLSDDDLRDLFAVPDNPRLTAAQREGRISLAGAQAKLTLRRDGQTWRLPTNGSPASHILKRTRLGIPYLVENEFFCMRLATAAGLPVPEVDYLDVNVPLLMICRFDRVEEQGVIRRIHQEDFCQATGTVPAGKYEAEGGPGLASCAAVIRQHSGLPIADLRLLVRWVAFNYLIGNEDAHAKNLALLYTDDGLRLAPFYDLVSSIVYRGLTRKAAMSIGGERRYYYVERRHWERCADAMELAFKVVRRVVLESAELVEQSMETVQQDAAKTFGSLELIDPIIEGTRQRVQAVRVALGAVSS